MREVMMRLADTKSDVDSVIGSLVVLEQMVRTLMNILSVSSFVKEHEEQLAASGIRIVQQAMQLVEKGQPAQQEQGALIVKTCAEAYCKLVDKLLEVKCASVLVALYGQRTGILELMADVLLLPMVPDPRMVFDPRAATPVQAFFNEAKGVIMEVLKSLINHLYLKYPPTTKLQPLYFHGRLQTILAEVNESLFQFRCHCRTPSDKLEPSVESFVVPAMHLVAKSIEIQDFYPIYAAVYKQMVVEVFLPEIVIGDREKAAFEDNEVEFVNLAFDTCFNQKSKTTKVLAMKAIENLSDKIDGAISFVGIGVLALADAVLGQKSEVEVLKETPTVESLLKSHFVKSHSADEVLDVCLLVITSISYHIVKRADLL